MSEERLDAKLTLGSASYFMREGTPREGQNALVVGPRRPSDPVQHPLTLVSDLETGEIDNIHLTAMEGQKRTKKWQIVPREMEPAVASWIRDNSTPLVESDIRGLGANYYCLSGWRVSAALHIAEGMVDAAVSLLVRPLMGLGVVRIKKESLRKGRVRVSGQLDVTRAIVLARKFRPFKRVLEIVLPVVAKRGGPRLIRLFLIRPERMSKGDVSVLIPKGPALPALVLVKWGEHRQIDLDDLIKQAGALYHRMELRSIIPNLSGLSSSVPPLFEFDLRSSLRSKLGSSQE